MKLVLCIENKDYSSFLECGKVYRVDDSAKTTEHAMLRAMDKSGKDCLCPERYFVNIKLPRMPQWLGNLNPLFKVLGIILKILSGIWTLAAWGQYKKPSDAWALIIGAFILYLMGWLCIYISRRLAAVSSEYLIWENPTAEVLYLRSFKSDSELAKSYVLESSIQNPFPNLLSDGLFETQFETGEERITGAMGIVGQPIAIGIPGEILPRIGAPRIYVSDDDDWKRIVEILMKSVKLVVIRVGLSKGVLDEIKLAKTCVAPKNLIFLISPKWKAQDYANFCNQLKEIIPSMPEIYFNEKEPLGDNGIILFDADWKGTFTYQDLINLLMDRELNLDVIMDEVLEELKMNERN